MTDVKGYEAIKYSISLLWTFGVNHQYLLVGENFSVSGNTIPLIKIKPIYIVSSNIINKNTC